MKSTNVNEKLAQIIVPGIADSEFQRTRQEYPGLHVTPVRERSPALQESGHQVVCPSHLTESPPCSIRVTLPSRPQWPVYPSHWACRAPFLRVCSRIARSGILPRRGGPGRCLGDASFCQALFRPWLMVALRQGEPGEADLPARCCRGLLWHHGTSQLNIACNGLCGAHLLGSCSCVRGTLL